jgi:hypothetical protein
MSIKASDEWKEHALHPEETATGENAETVAPADRATSTEAEPFGTDPNISQSGTGSGEASTPGALPGSGPLDQPAGTPTLDGYNATQERGQPDPL